MAKKNKKKKISELWKEFKAFITKGNVLDMAIGVVIGGAFSAIVTAVVNILMSVATWGVPGGISGLVTPLPPAPGNTVQAGYNVAIGLTQYFPKADLNSMSLALAEFNHKGVDLTAYPGLIDSAKEEIMANYKLYGDIFYYDKCSLINWGALINAVISFLIIAITLFIILKVYTGLKKKAALAAAKAKAELEAKLGKRAPKAEDEGEGEEGKEKPEEKPAE